MTFSFTTGDVEKDSDEGDWVTPVVPIDTPPEVETGIEGGCGGVVCASVYCGHTCTTITITHQLAE